jgi:hypothetical protein
MRRLLAEPPPTLPVPDLKTWDFLGEPLDQGKTATCTAHAGAHMIHAAPIRHRGFLNPWQLYREVVLFDEYLENDIESTEADNQKLQAGSSGTGVAKAIEKRGLISEYLWAAEMRDALLWVLTRGPVMIGTNWYRSMFKPTPEGFVKIGSTSPIAGGHEWLLRGVDMKRGVALAVNSWGPDWNAAATGRWVRAHVRPGHFLIDFGTLERLFNEDGDAVSALEKAGERPR